MPSVLAMLTKIVGAIRGAFTVFVLACYGYMMVAVGFQVYRWRWRRRGRGSWPNHWWARP